MSRGLGRVARSLLSALEGRTELVDTFALAVQVYNLVPDETGMTLLSDAQIVSVRRALVSLAEMGKVFKIMRGHNKRAYWADERLGLWLTIRKGQLQSMEFKDAPSMDAHIAWMLPMIQRASAIGLDLGEVFTPRLAS